MTDEYIREGETFEVTLTDTDVTADTVTITITNDIGHITQETASYSLVDDVPTATIQVTDPTLVEGEYEYMYTVTYTDGVVRKFPDISECDGDCNLPKFVVCEANDIIGS